MQDEKILVINYSAPELNHLAAALDSAGVLLHYVRPYANQSRIWERVIANVPWLGNFYGRTFGRRILPSELRREHLREVAVVADMLSAAARYFMGKPGKQLSGRLHWHIQKCVAAAGAKYAAEAELVVSSYHVARSAFKHAGCNCVLNYPIAHHSYIKAFVAEEAEREPDFAATLPDWTGTAKSSEIQHLDEEIDLADFILVGSNFVRDSFVVQGVPPEKLIVVPYGADVRRFSPPPEKSGKRLPGDCSNGLNLLYVGHINQRKGISYLLRAYAAFQGPDTRLRVVGSYYGNPDALTPYRELFEHIPHAPQTALANYYREADVFVFPTLIEGMPLVVLEAMASGLPVITTPNGPGDIVRDGVDGFVVPIRNADAIVEKLEYLRSHPEERLRMGRNARQRALEYSWSAYQQRVTRTLLSLLKGENISLPLVAESGR